ncbi:hypothetical protein DPMN_143501 [Dreissena polymorpha]|uniref:HAT C-terminal dimerisation domain-containing protein n=1 Tax=Dreissena polymorpha TaxID=45954 RepID=A0A9D4GJ97_DREPO|nr:hypothetical protein DPMN_143501 [Dreissena polymorpha]
MPATSASRERSLSSMKRKTYSYSTMGEDRLTLLAVLYIRRESVEDIEKVFNTFASTESRNMQFL